MEDLKLVEGDIVPIYENVKGERVINARELHEKLGNKRKFSDWIKQRIQHYKFAENQDFIRFHNFVKGDIKGYGNKTIIEYLLTMDMAKELCMVENNEIGRRIRKYFIEVEKRYRTIVEKPRNVFDIMHMALNQIEESEKRLSLVEIETKENKDEIKNIKSKIDVIIQKDYCLASDIAEQLKLYSENGLPHSNLVGAIARVLGMKIEFKHYFEDENIAIVPDISKGNQYYQVYYKPKAVEDIVKWFDRNKKELEYKIIYERNTKNGKRGEVREQGYRMENICYKVKNN